MATVAPLRYNVKYFNEDGTPTPAMQRLWSRQFSVNTDVTVVQAEVDALELRVDDLEAVQIVAGVGLSGGGDLLDPIITIDLEDTAVTPATYGSSTHVGQFTVNQQGRLTFAQNVAIAGAGNSIVVEDESVSLGSFSTINFLGSGVSAVDAGSGRVNVTISGGGGSTLEVEDESVSLGSFSIMNFTGAGVTATDAGSGRVNVNVPGDIEYDPPLSADFGSTILNGAGAALVERTDTANGLYLTGNFTTAHENALLPATIPGSFTLTVGIDRVTGIGGAGVAVGVFLRNSSNGRLECLLYQPQSAIFQRREITVATLSANVASTSYANRGVPVWMRMTWDGTNFTMQVSGNGRTWDTFVTSTAASGYLTAAGGTVDQYGLIVTSATGGQNAGTRYKYFLAA